MVRQAALAWIRNKCVEAAERICDHIHSIDVIVVGDAEMRQLHREHKGIDATTDVLTFEMEEGGERGSGGPRGGREPKRSGGVEIVVCADEAARRAKELGHSVERELLLYVVHGLLHCCGFDDGSASEAKRMHREEDRILEAMGVGATYWKPKAGSRRRKT